MEKKINIAELLKDCPKGMELDCTLIEGLEFDCIVDNKYLPIRCRIKNPNGGYNVYAFTKYGCWLDATYAKCVIFPKGKTTWEGFVPPCKFKDGDILATDLGSVFYLNTRLNTDEYYGCYVGIGGDGSFHICEPFAYKECCELATKEEKAKLFKAIRGKGYKWDTKTKTLGKLPKFKIGDRIRKKGDYISGFITLIDFDNFYKVEYDSGSTSYVSVQAQDEWELVPDKFDIDTLKPFDKVLVRNSDKGRWVGQFYTFYDFMREYPFECVYNCWKYCIPYEKNEHLLGTANDCDEYYKNWE